MTLISPINFAQTTQVRLRRATAAQIAANPPVEAEPFYDLTAQRMGVGGGSDGIVQQWKSQFLEHSVDNENASAVNMRGFLSQFVSILNFGGDNTGVSANDTALANALEYAYLNHNCAILFPPGTYRFTGITTINQGVPLIGLGPTGNNDEYGVSFIHYSNGDFLIWNGDGEDFAGTGGAIRNIFIFKAAGYSGGVATKLVGTDDDHRPGEFVFENIVIANADTGLWSKGIFIDGSANTTPGTKGVRSVFFDKVRVASCTENNKYVHITQGVHIVSSYLQIDQGNGTGTVGATIDGDSDNLILSGLIINGNIILSPTATANIALYGRISALSVTTANAVGGFYGQLGSLTGNSSANNFSVTSGSNWYGPLNVASSFSVNTDAFNVDPINKRITWGGQTNLGYSAQGIGLVASEVKNTVTRIGTIGVAFTTLCPDGDTFTFDSASAKMFTIATGGGAGALIFTDYKSGGIDIISDPSAEFEASSTPSAGQTGIFKSVNSHTISITNNTGGAVTYSILMLGAVSSPTDPV